MTIYFNIYFITIIDSKRIGTPNMEQLTSMETHMDAVAAVPTLPPCYSKNNHCQTDFHFTRRRVQMHFLYNSSSHYAVVECRREEYELVKNMSKAIHTTDP